MLYASPPQLAPSLDMACATGLCERGDPSQPRALVTVAIQNNQDHICQSCLVRFCRAPQSQNMVVMFQLGGVWTVRAVTVTLWRFGQSGTNNHHFGLNALGLHRRIGP
jgi:hypothetical protein